MNLLELRTWKELGSDPSSQNWYRVSGIFMRDSLMQADQNNEYHMLDSTTWAMYQSQMKNLTILVQGPANNYEMCLVSTAKNPNLTYNHDYAVQFYEFLCGPEGQNLIKNFGKEKYGQALYYPDIID